MINLNIVVSINSDDQYTNSDSSSSAQKLPKYTLSTLRICHVSFVIRNLNKLKDIDEFKQISKLIFRKNKYLSIKKSE